MLKSLTLLPERIADPTLYPFTVPAIRSLTHLTFDSRITFFTGENGSGKSTLLEAIAAHIGFGREGGNRNCTNESTDSVRATDPLTRALRTGFGPYRSTEGFYFRAESLYNIASHLDQLDREQVGLPGVPIWIPTEASPSTTVPTAKTFFTVLDHKFRRSGLFLLDEPEAALSPQRQLAFLVLIHDTLRDYKDAQFIISTHSPILLGYPAAQILSFDNGHIHPISYEDTSPAQILQRFVQHRQSFLAELFNDPPTLFD